MSDDSSRVLIKYAGGGAVIGAATYGLKKIKGK